MATSDLIAAPTDAYKPEAKDGLASKYPEADFQTGGMGIIPFMEPNVDPRNENETIQKVMHETFGDQSVDSCLCTLFCCATGIGACWVCCRMELIEEGQWGFAQSSGVPVMMTPGRYFISSPLDGMEKVVSRGDEAIISGPVSIIRVPQGSVGLADHNSLPEILLPGRHVRTSATFRWIKNVSLQNDLIEHGPIKLLTVKSGGVRVCYDAGKVRIFREGRYGINSATFVVAGFINTQQQNVKFEAHKVLLDGGISLLVEGLLTFQVVDPAKLIQQLGERDLLQTVSQVTKAELSRVFSGIHLEQISTAQMAKKERKDDPSLLGGAKPTDSEGESSRNAICSEIIKSVRPQAEQWGVKIINFQMESTTLADKKYAAEYEEASLAMAKAKSTRRAVEANNDIMIQQAKAAAASLKIEAEGQKTALLIQAEAKAEARRIEAKGRNDAAILMDNDFAKKFALSGQQVEFASALKAKVLTVVPSSAVGGALINQTSFVASTLREERKGRA